MSFCGLLQLECVYTKELNRWFSSEIEANFEKVLLL